MTLRERVQLIREAGGEDLNGILNWMSNWIRYQQAGWIPGYDPTFSAAIGGYPLGAILRNAAGTGFWISHVENNITDPDAGGAGWSVFTQDRAASANERETRFLRTGTFVLLLVTAMMNIIIAAGSWKIHREREELEERLCALERLQQASNTPAQLVRQQCMLPRPQ